MARVISQILMKKKHLFLIKETIKFSFLYRKSKQEDTITYLMGHMPTTNIRGQLEDYIE